MEKEILRKRTIYALSAILLITIFSISSIFAISWYSIDMQITIKPLISNIQNLSYNITSATISGETEVFFCNLNSLGKPLRVYFNWVNSTIELSKYFDYINLTVWIGDIETGGLLYEQERIIRFNGTNLEDVNFNLITTVDTYEVYLTFEYSSKPIMEQTAITIPIKVYAESNLE